MSPDQKEEIRALIREVLDEPGRPFGNWRDRVGPEAIKTPLRGNPHHPGTDRSQ